MPARYGRNLDRRRTPTGPSAFSVLGEPAVRRLSVAELVGDGASVDRDWALLLKARPAKSLYFADHSSGLSFSGATSTYGQ
jgi:hypothetical protein